MLVLIESVKLTLLACYEELYCERPFYIDMQSEDSNTRVIRSDIDLTQQRSRLAK